MTPLPRGMTSCYKNDKKQVSYTRLYTTGLCSMSLHTLSVALPGEVRLIDCVITLPRKLDGASKQPYPSHIGESVIDLFLVAGYSY